MRYSFIITAYNIEDFITPCLHSLGDCVVAGDEVIIIDDGSTDRTVEEIDAALADLFRDEDITVIPMYLGANTHGGVGIPANIGLATATGDAVFFVDGDDWVDADGFAEARARFEQGDCDLLLANYAVHNVATGRNAKPVDHPRWADVAWANTPEKRRALALSMIGVPWRKIYRRGFLEETGIRFPEGPFFYEDNPFHWQNCLAAGDIAFLDQVICYHRISRAGQTMAAAGAELAAFFHHYDQIVADLPDDQYRADALRWLLENMAWHFERLRPDAFWAYATRAYDTLAGIAEADWQVVRTHPMAVAAWPVARALARGEVAGVVADWRGQQVLRRLDDLGGRVGHLENVVTRTEHTTHHLRHTADAARELGEFRALAALDKSRKP